MRRGFLLLLALCFLPACGGAKHKLDRLDPGAVHGVAADAEHLDQGEPFGVQSP